MNQSCLWFLTDINLTIPLRSTWQTNYRLSADVRKHIIINTSFLRKGGAGFKKILTWQVLLDNWGLSDF